jgi:twinkle protein
MAGARFVGHMPCNYCGSSDAVGMYSDGRGKCFNCNKVNYADQYENGVEGTQTETKQMVQTMQYNESLSDIQTYDSRGVRERSITKRVSEFFDMKVSYAENGSIDAHYYPYTVAGKVVAYKKRQLPKNFRVVGDMKDPKLELFGQSKFTGGKYLVITEGELDAMAVAQASLDTSNRIYPVVSLPSSSNMKILLNNREWIRGFSEVILMFDKDEAGDKALTEAAKIIGWDKVKVATLQENDPCDTLVKHGSVALKSAIFNAKAYTPASIVRGESIWEAYQERKAVESIPYPKCLEGLNDKLEGMRKGEIVLFTSGTGSGKSTMIKEIILELQDNTEDNIGLVSLEESIGDSAEKFIKMFTPENPTPEEEREAFERVFGNERLILLDHNGAVSDSSLIDQIENLCLLGCEYIILDHITIAVSEGADGKTGNEAIDSVMSDLLKIVKKHNVWLGLISHLRKSQGKSFEEGHLASIDDIKGSGSIKQISFDIVTFARNLVAESEEERNTIRLRVLKSRFTGKTGDAGSASYDTITRRLTGQQDFDSYNFG